MSEGTTVAVQDRIDEVEAPLRRVFREYGLPRIHWFAVAVAMNLVARLSALVPALVLGTAIDAVFNETGAYDLPLVPASWIPNQPEAQFWFSVSLIVAAFVLTAVCTWAQGITSDVFAHRSLHAVRVDTFRRMQELDMAFFDEQETGEAMSILNQDATNLERFLDQALKNGTRLIIMVLAIGGLLLWINWQLALVTLVAVPVMALFTWWFSRTVAPRYDAVRSSIGDLNTRLENSIGGMQLVKTANTEEFETERVEEASWNFYTTNIDVLKIAFVYRPGMRMLAGLSFATTFIVGGLWLFSGPPLFFSGELTVGNFVVFIFMTQRFIDPLAQISNIIDWTENARASGKRIFGLMDTPVRIEDDPDAVELDAVDGEVAYDDVAFSYDGEETILRDVSFDADAGDTVAYVGPTGAGKSTAVKLLMRLYDVDEGAISVDGHDIRDVTVGSLRESIGYVSQETYLFDGTVAENIRYGEFDASREEIEEAAKAAEAHEFITDLSDGYDTQVGERGARLSGGQRQRISIARTVLQDPDILILDEATSAVDTETEVLIQRSLDRLAADRTTFVIAHRLSTVTDAETILVLEDGRVVERGTHQELLEEDGLYANLWAVQAGEIDDLPDEFVDRARGDS
ncbi:ABC transporter ATP-binding protein [Halosimplex rubrum]|uniref:ABC transporter ATP-binding protein n=1 Tax=Halosimplex rubrum TaxID=869889 RepID=A0A7D5SRX8_9EURY|nr:ABC transporter ATP-binding protein [Halosimplex rubrum]QLH79107.1 ABC transporter ATP-binding protein [Halosimplex rubrum]